jgi:hypothetical protein
MSAYLYVLWAVEDELVKVGISRKPLKRISTHSGNSSNPLRFEQWKVYQFESPSEAKKIESLTVERLQKRGFAYRKRELFKCAPTEATSVIDRLCNEVGTSALKNFPVNMDEILRSFVDFPSLPNYGLEALTPEQRELYWRGVEDALGCIAYFDGMRVSRSDFWQIRRMVKSLSGTNSELWTTIENHYGNCRSRNSDEDQSIINEKIATVALESIKGQRRRAYNDWQQLDDEDVA